MEKNTTTPSGSIDSMVGSGKPKKTIDTQVIAAHIKAEVLGGTPQTGLSVLNKVNFDPNCADLDSGYSGPTKDYKG